MNNYLDYKRIGLLIPHTDINLESDLQRELKSNYILHTERLWLDDVSIESEKIMLEDEVPRGISYLQNISLDIAIFGCTSASVIYGTQGDVQITEKMKASLNCEAISAFNSILKYALINNTKQPVLFTPYPPEVTDKVANSFCDGGVPIQYAKGMNMNSDTEISLQHPNKIISFIIENFPKNLNSDFLIISCTNLRAYECANYLKKIFNVPVMTSNLAIYKNLIEII